MRNTHRKGTSLIEVLVVIVVFLVGILAVLQVFPPGLKILQTTARNSVAAQLGESESQRILGRSSTLAEMIVPVTYSKDVNNVFRVVVDTGRSNIDLMPPRDPNGVGRIDQTGQVLLSNGSSQVGPWQRLSGANLFNRVIGESIPVPAPRQVPLLGFGGVYSLTFGPAYYFPTGAGIGEEGLLQVYGNDFVRRFADRIPDPGGRWRDNEFIFVTGEDSDQNYFNGEDQIWIAPSAARKYRIAFSFAYNNNNQRTDQYDIIVQANLDPNVSVPYAVRAGNFWVVSLKKLVSQQDIYGHTMFSETYFRYADFNSVRVQRIYQELPINAAYSSDPYEYKVLGAGSQFCMGTLMFNPSGFGTRVRSNQSNNEALLARIDYTAYDWRIIKEDLRVPSLDLVGGTTMPKQVKLALNAVKAMNTEGTDGRIYDGLGFSAPVLPDTTGADDVVVMDLDSGGVILGNNVNSGDSAWSVNKTAGHISFRDVDNNPANGLSAYMKFPVVGGWSPRQLIPDITNRTIRVMYQGLNEWSVQPLKAARTYRVSRYLGAAGLSPGECFVGGSLDANGTPVGSDRLLYFAPFDRGQKVIAGEIWLTMTTDQFGTFPLTLNDQELQIGDLTNLNGGNLAVADVGQAAIDYWKNTHPTDNVQAVAFDWSRGYSVRRVRGASLKVRVMWNPGAFRLEADPVKNYNELDAWMRNTRRTENESLQIGGRN